MAREPIVKSEICANCGDKYCCRGLCAEMNAYLLMQRKNKRKGGKANANL